MLALIYARVVQNLRVLLFHVETIVRVVRQRPWHNYLLIRTGKCPYWHTSVLVHIVTGLLHGRRYRHPYNHPHYWNSYHPVPQYGTDFQPPTMSSRIATKQGEAGSEVPGTCEWTHSPRGGTSRSLL